MCVGDEDVIRFIHIVDSQHFGQNTRTLQPCVQEDDETVGFHAKCGGTWVINEPHEPRQQSRDTECSGNLPNHSIVASMLKLLPVNAAKWRRKQVIVQIDFWIERYSQVGATDPLMTKPGDPRNSAPRGELILHSKLCTNYRIPFNAALVTTYATFRILSTSRVQPSSLACARFQDIHHKGESVKQIHRHATFIVFFAIIGTSAQFIDTDLLHALLLMRYIVYLHFGFQANSL